MTKMCDSVTSEDVRLTIYIPAGAPLEHDC